MTDLSPSPPQLVIDPGGHQAKIQDVLFTPDGKELLSISEDKTIRIWDVETGALVRTLRGQMEEGHEGKLYAGALAPTDENGRRWLALGGFLAHGFGIDDDKVGNIRLMDLNASPDAPLRLLKGHDDVILSLAFSPDGKWLLSGSGDGTARLWDVSLAVDTGISTSSSTGILARLNASISALLNTSMQTGGAIQILRGHADDVYAVGFSPDGERLVTGSLDHTLRLWDGAGRLVKILEGHTDKVLAAAFAPDGRYLLSGSEDKTIRLWNGRTGAFLRVLAAQDSIVASLAISPDGKKLLTGPGSHPLTANVFALPSGERLLQFDGHKNIVPATALSPDGDLAATGGGDDQEIYLWDLATGAVRHKLVGKGNIIWSVGFARDGGSLAWGTLFDQSGYNMYQINGSLQYRFQLRRDREFDDTAPGGDAPGHWKRADTEGKRAAADGSLTDDCGKRSASCDTPAASNGMDTAIGGSPAEYTGKRSASADGPSSGSGKRTTIEGAPDTNEGKRNGPEGWRWCPVDHGNTAAGGAARQGGFDLAWGGEALSEDAYLRAIERVDETRIRTANDQIHPTLEILQGDAVRHITRGPTDGDDHRSLTLTPDGRAVISGGGNGRLASYDVASGEKIHDFIGHTGDVWAVAPSPDGRFLISGSHDQTVRLWAIARGKLLLSIFPARGGEWVAWTPEGYYTASLNGDRLIGWHINQGEDRLALYYPAEQFAGRFRKPRVVAHYLATGGDIDRAIRLANAELPNRERTIRTEKTDLLALAPPAVFIAEPFERTITTDQPALRLKAEARSFNRLPVEKIWVAVNGRRPDEGGIVRLDDGLRARLDVGLELSPGENHVAVYARNRHSRSEPEVVIVTRTSARASRRPNLYLLAIGVSEYANPKYNLSFAHKDAEAVADILRGQQGKLYGRVESRCLADAEANREGVLAGLEWLTEASTQRDVAVIFLAGHGMKERGHYYFLPHDVDPRRLRVTGVRWSEFEHTFQDIPGTRWLLADTCRSGGITGKRATIPRDAGDMTDALRALKAVEGGVVVMSASNGQEASLESPQWRHGAFTKALIDGIGEGRADHDGDGRIGIKELDLYLTDRVKELTKGKQHPMTEIPRMMSNFPVAIVAEKAQEKGG